MNALCGFKEQNNFFLYAVTVFGDDTVIKTLKCLRRFYSIIVYVFCYLYDFPLFSYPFLSVDFSICIGHIITYGNSPTIFFLI